MTDQTLLARSDRQYTQSIPSSAMGKKETLSPNQHLLSAVVLGDLTAVKKALASGAEINCTNANGSTALNCAAERHQSGIVARLLAAGADANVANHHKMTPLLYAAETGSMSILDKLLAAGATVNCSNTRGVTPLMYAAAKGLTTMVARLVDAGASVNACDDQGSTALWYAARTGHALVVDTLVAAGADVNIANTSHVSPLQMATQQGHTQVAQKLVAAGADRTFLAENLRNAALIGDVDGVAKALASGADVNTVNEHGNTMLSSASEKNHVAVVEKLLEAGADPNRANKHLVTPLIYAAEKGFDVIARKLLAAGAKVDLMDDGEITALWYAAQNGHTAIVEMLVAEGANVNSPTKFGSMPLSAAGHGGHVAVVKFLLSSGADIDHVDNDGDSALIGAVVRDQEDTARALFQAGADPFLRNNAGHTAREIALTKGNTGIVQLLRNYEASSTMFFRAVEREELIVVERLLNDVDMDCRGPHARTPLHVAAHFHLIEAIKSLARDGADLTARDDSGKVPLHLACASGTTESIRILSRNGAHVDQVDDGGLSPLDIATMNGNLDVVRILCHLGASFRNVSADGRTILHHGVRSGNAALVEYLLAQGVGTKVNAKDDHGRTPLHYVLLPVDKLPNVDDGWGPNTAASDEKPQLATYQREHDVEILRLLVSIDGVAIDERDKNGDTALLIASACGNIHAVRLLLHAGANPDLGDRAGRSPLAVAGSQEVRRIIQLYINRQLFHERCFAMLNDATITPTVPQVEELIPLITAVYDLRLVLTVVGLLEEASPRSALLKSAFDVVVAHKLTFDVDACVFFKLVLERCERDGLLTRADFLKYDRIAENVNTESADWVIEIKQQLRANRWRLDTNDQRMQAMMHGIHQVYAMVLENRSAIVATTTRVETLQTQVREARTMIERLVTHAQHESARLDGLHERVKRNEDHTKRVAAHLAQHVQHVSAFAQQFEQRLARSERNIHHVAEQFSTFRDGMAEYHRQEQKVKRIKAVCSVIASVAGFVLAPLLDQAASALVDFMNPLEVATLFGVNDPAEFLSDKGGEVLTEAIRNQLEKMSIEVDEFEALLREGIALTHPEIVDDCKHRGLKVHADSGKTEEARDAEPLLQEEETNVSKIIVELRNALDEMPKTESSGHSTDTFNDLSSKDNASSVDASFHFNAESIERLSIKGPHGESPSGSVDTGSKPCVEIGGLSSPSAPQTQRPTKLRTRDDGDSEHTVELPPDRKSSDVETSHLKDVAQQDHEETAEQKRSRPDTDASTAPPRTTDADTSDTVANTLRKVVLVGDQDRFPYHVAVQSCRGDVSVFKQLAAKIDNNVDAYSPTEVCVVETVTTRELLCAAEYAYLRGDRDVGDAIAARMNNCPDFDDSPALSVKLEESLDDFPYVLAVQESGGDEDMCEDLLDGLDEDAHAIEAKIRAVVVRKRSRLETWTIVELASELGYLELVKYLVKSVCGNVPAKMRINAIKLARERAQSSA